MKSAGRLHPTLRASLTASLLMLLIGCGNAEPPETVAAGSDSGQVPMKGYAGFGSQCVSGFNSDPKGVKLELWSCPYSVNPVELAEPIQPVYLSADCAKKLLTIRSQDKAINVTWELMPDGSFYVSQEGLSAKIKNDGAGNANCVIPLITDFWGRVECETPTGDRAKIKLEMVMWFDKKAPASAPSCQIPSDKCYFHALTSVDQCI